MAGRFSGYILPSHPSCMVEDRFSICEEYLYEPKVPQWALIRNLLQQPIKDTPSLEDLLSNLQYDLQFTTLSSTLQLFSEKEPNFFTFVWPRLVKCALSLHHLFPEGVLQTLEQNVTCSVSLSREQIASLLAHMFLCSLQPPAWSKFWANFGIWYNSDSPPVRAYLFCLLEYFSQLDESGKPANPLEMVHFHRRVLFQPPNWSTLSMHFYSDIVATCTNLDPLPTCHVEVSFANKDVGFGVSGTQEEVKIAMSLEACVAMLISPTLQDNETLLIHGAKQVGTCQGIGRDVTYSGPLEHTTASKDWGRRWIIAMDAMELDVMENGDHQPARVYDVIHELRQNVLERELNKAFCGFSGVGESCSGDEDNGLAPQIATGHWGCGSFGGNRHAKAIIQLMAAAAAKTRLVYHDIEGGGDGTSPFLEELVAFVAKMVDKKVTVAQLYSALLQVSRAKNDEVSEQNLFDICMSILS